MYIQKCEFCGKDYTTNKKKICCSRKCFKSLQAKRLYGEEDCAEKIKFLNTNLCKNCGYEFKEDGDRTVFCSSNCCREYWDEHTGDEKRTFRFKIFARDSFQCAYCGEKGSPDNSLHVDHIYPLSEGGKNDIFNLITACSKCNFSKNAFLLSEETILKFWKRNRDLPIIGDYDSLKERFDKIYQIV